MKKKVCIVTNFNNTGNYGAVLQAYALNKRINDFGLLCETLCFNIREQNGSKSNRYLKRLKRFEIKGIIEDLVRDAEKLAVTRKIKYRKTALKNFKDKIPHTKEYLYDELVQLPFEYDFFICGSDQVWRPTFQGELVEIYWLKQIKGENVTKASYSASIGLESLPERLWEEASSYLRDFDFISVREEQAKAFLTKICNKNIIVTLDPVFLLNKSEWKSKCSNPQIKEEYIFVYMIHGSKELLYSIKKFAQKMNLKIVVFPYMAYKFRFAECKFGDYRIFNASPEDFLGFVDNAKYVFTDSFHVTAFSIIFQKDFYSSVANAAAVSRIQNLFEKCGISERMIPAQGLNTDEYLSLKMPDWKEVEKSLENEIKESVKYLKDVLQINTQ